jgi:hypothetical protein
VFFKGWAVAIFQVFYGSRGRSVPMQIDDNLALLVIFGCEGVYPARGAPHVKPKNYAVCHN